MSSKYDGLVKCNVYTVTGRLTQFWISKSMVRDLYLFLADDTPGHESSCAVFLHRIYMGAGLMILLIFVYSVDQVAC